MRSAATIRTGPDRAAAEGGAVRAVLLLGIVGATAYGDEEAVRADMGGVTRLAIIGAGPAGLFLARLIGRTLPGVTVDVYERNRREDVAGFGVALSDRTMRELATWDPEVAERLGRVVRPLSGIELRLPGERLRYDGFPIATVSRDTMLALLSEAARRVGARLHYGHDARADQFDADVTVLANGARSAQRTARAADFGTTVRTGAARYIWLGSAADIGDAATMFFVPTEYGPMAAHAYSCGDGLSTVVVELDEVTWRRAGLDVRCRPGGVPGEISGDGLALLDDVFADHLGAPLVSNRSRWSRFDVVTNQRWSDGNLVLVGDAAHTAHFSVASGTTMALADAAALAAALREQDIADAFAAYERARRGRVTRVQRLAGPSMRWWENYGRRLHLPPAQFGMHFITRSTAISYLGLRRRCPARVDEAEAAYRRAAGVDPDGPARNAVAEPLTRGALRLPHRLVSLGGPASGGTTGPTLGAGDGIDPRPRPVAELHPLPPGSVPAADGWTVGTEGRLLVRGRHALRIVALAPPDPTASAPVDGDGLVAVAALRGRGVDGVLLLPDFGVPGWWDRTVEFGGRIRAEAGMVVVGCVPMDWSIDLCRDPSVDAWPTRIHLALVSARLDLVVPWPCSATRMAPGSEAA
ncbi:FAD-dependent monooxygenase [Micromonospora sp. NPDC002717]|uniref:FAD-dependent monooxygenase n=1 Tax=Micromonospora sp. NPDC002717 TaxID=3154424 RepID=UPI00333041EF